MNTLTRKVRLADIVTLAARVWNVPESGIKGRTRKRELFHARAAVTAVARAMPVPISYPMLGAYLGGRDHSSVINGFNKLDVYARFDGFSDKLAELFRLCETEGPFVKEREHALRLLPVSKPKTRTIPKVRPIRPDVEGKKAKNNFDAPESEKDGAHKFHDAIAKASIGFGAKLRAARLAA